MNDGYQRLADEIILKAVKDYRSALRTLRRNPFNETALFLKDNCESFFLSKWFSTLTKINGKRLMMDIQSERND